MSSSEKTVIALWGGHRNPRQEPKGTPSNVDKGIRELANRGHEVVSVFPAGNRGPLMRWLLGNKGVYKTTIPSVIAIARRTGAPIYTSSLDWARIISRLKRLGIVRNRLIVRWAGIDTDLDALAAGTSKQPVDLQVLMSANVCLFASWVFYQKALRLFPQYAVKFEFWPTGVDSDFYERAGADATTCDDVVAVGSDNKRDWALPLALAARGINIGVLTESAPVRKLFDQLPAEAARHAKLYMNVGYAASARIMANARCLLIATLPNERFSGSTTVGVAAALRKPLLIDDADEIASYGLATGSSCELFERGNVESAMRAAHRVLDDAAHATKLSHGIASLAEQLDLDRYATEVERCLSADWFKRDFAPSIEPLTSVQREERVQ